jgi:hypothetical protein
MARRALGAVLVLAAVTAVRSMDPAAAQAPTVTVVKVVGDRHQLALRSDGTVIG